MALSQLRPMIMEGDRPAQPAQSGFTRLPDGSLIMIGQKPVVTRPGVLSGLRAFIASKIGPKPVEDKWWIPPTPELAPAAVTAPVAQPMVPSLPGYNEWKEIEDEAAKEQQIKEQLGEVSRRIMNSPALIEGKWSVGR